MKRVKHQVKPKNEQTSQEAPKPERFLIQKVEVGVLVFLEYVEKVKGRRDKKVTVIQEKLAEGSPADLQPILVGEHNGTLTQKSKEAVAGSYEAGVNRGRTGVQGGIMNLLGIGGLVPQINQVTSVLNVLDAKVFEHEKMLKPEDAKTPPLPK